MKTIALRFSNNFAPEAGTIAEHQKLIDELGYVWYGKLGSRISSKVKDDILAIEDPRILLIHSGSTGRYWAYIDKIQNEVPSLEGIPSYYRDQAKGFSTWFKVKRFQEAPRNVLSKCSVASSGALLSIASRHSMSSYFIINYNEE